jgi:DNA-binding transcriptional ArsR family regulator
MEMMMESDAVVRALGALAQEHRLAAIACSFRPGRMACLPVSLPSAGRRVLVDELHLAALTVAGLVTQRRQGRLIIYSANYSAMNGCSAISPRTAAAGFPARVFPATGAMSAAPSITRRTWHDCRHRHLSQPRMRTSRNALAMIRNAGIEPHVVEYLKTPPSRAMLESLIARPGSPRAPCCAKRHTLSRTRLDNPDLTTGRSSTR